MNLIDFIFPRTCVICHESWAYVCKMCKKLLQPHPEICPVCHRFSADYKVCLNCRSEKNFCFRTPTSNTGGGWENHTGDSWNIKYEWKWSNLWFQEQSVFLEGIIVPFAYDELLKKLIMKLKYFHKKDIGGFLVDRLKIALEANQSFQREFNNCPPFEKEGWCEAQEDLSRATRNPSSASADSSSFYKGRQKVFITRVPTHRYREYFVKGYNQSKVLAKKLSETTGIPRVDVARKTKRTKTQASLNREWRLKNLKNAFSLVEKPQLRGDETLLIVDDITTTWSTINELAKLVKFHYPKIKVRWAVLWRHIG